MIGMRTMEGGEAGEGYWDGGMMSWIGCWRGAELGGDGQPKRKRGMSYGTRSGARKSLEADPTVIPSTNTLGFLGRLPFKLGGTLRYKPSAADLQEHPGASRAEPTRDLEEEEPLISEDDEHSAEEVKRRQAHRRNRSSTTSSGETSDSFRSRGDIFPSDGEDDAVPLDDEFAMVLEERRMTGDGASSGKARSGKGKRPAAARRVSRTMSRTTHSSRSRPTLDGNRSSSAQSLPILSDPATPDMVQTPSMADLQYEEERIQIEEDEEISRKRQSAARLAVERGLSAEPEEPVFDLKEPVADEEIPRETENGPGETSEILEPPPEASKRDRSRDPPGDGDGDGFVAANLPHFG